MDQLNLPGAEAHQQRGSLARCRRCVEVMAAGRGSFVELLIYRLVEVRCLRLNRFRREKKTFVLVN